MADFRHCALVGRTAPRGDNLVLAIYFALTVGMDRVVAVFVGVVLAALIFMRRMAELSEVDLGEVNGAERIVAPEGVLYGRICGPLLFGAAQRAMQEIRTIGSARFAVINLESPTDRLWRAGIPVVIAAANPRVQVKVKPARFSWAGGRCGIRSHRRSGSS